MSDHVTSARTDAPRRVDLAIARIDAWTVMKVSFLLSVALGIALVIATIDHEPQDDRGDDHCDTQGDGQQERHLHDGPRVDARDGQVNSAGSVAAGARDVVAHG